MICVVEPTAAPALKASVAAGKPVHADGPVSNMGRLDCKEPSFLALEYLAREADAFMTLDDDYVADAILKLGQVDIETSPSGGAGFAGLVAAADAGALSLDESSKVLIFVSEGPSDD
jgi:diaminopropionate ammonia-lyase